MKEKERGGESADFRPAVWNGDDPVVEMVLIKETVETESNWKSSRV